MTPKKADTWMPLYVADYLRDTMHLSTEQHGAYMLLLMACWSTGGSLPNDPAQLAGITRLPPAAWRRLSPILLAFFTVDGERLTHKRVTAERERAQRLSQVRQDAAGKGNEARWGRAEVEGTRSQRLTKARETGTHTKAEWACLVEATGNQCVKCGTPGSELIGGALCKDHIQAIYKGGSDGLENLQPLCRNCNTSKGGDCADLRGDASPGWRKRLAECLAKLPQTSPPSPSPSPDGEKKDADASSVGSAKPMPTAKAKGQPWLKDTDFVSAWTACTEPMRRRSSQRLAWGRWKANTTPSPDKLAALKGYLQRDPDVQRTGGPGLHLWLRDKLEEWLANPAADSVVVLPWRGPAEVREAVRGSLEKPDYADSYLKACAWQSDPPALITENGFTADILRKQCGRALAEIGVKVLVKGRAA